jgi:type I restriction enzyme S subunit
MNSKKKTTDTKEEAKPALVPKLRFPEFRDAEGWKETQLQKIAQPVPDRAVTGDGDNILSLSGEHGLVLQSDYFGKKVAGDSAERYLKLRRNDFVYNDRTTKASTFGTIKRLSKYDGGIVSPIYKCFRFHPDDNPVFWEWYFESGSHDAALGGLVNEGARAGRFNISISQFLSTAVWRPHETEQQKIASCLSSVDELMAAQGRKVDALKTHKKGLMQQLFPREGETQPRLRFPEFQNAGEWEESQLAKLTTRISDGIHTTPNYQENGEYAFINGNNLVNGKILIDEKTKRVNVDEFKKHRKPLDANSILMSINGTIGNLAFYRNEDVILGKSACFINVDIGVVDRIFIYNLLQTDKVKNAFTTELTGSTIKNLSLGAIKGVLISVPTLPEQQRIATCLSSLDTLITAETQKLESLKTHKRGLMQQFFPSPEAT